MLSVIKHEEPRSTYWKGKMSQNNKESLRQAKKLLRIPKEPQSDRGNIIWTNRLKKNYTAKNETQKIQY